MVSSWVEAVRLFFRSTNLDRHVRRSDRSRGNFHCQSDEYITVELVRQFILALSNEFDEGLFIALDGTPYFRSSKVTELEKRDDLHFARLPSHSLVMNPDEE